MPLFRSNSTLRQQLDAARAHAASSEAAAKQAEAAVGQALAAIEALRSAQTAAANPGPSRGPDSLWGKVSAERVLGEGEEVWGRSAEVRLDEHGKPSLDSVPGVLARLESNRPEVRAEGTLLLAMIVEGVSGEEAMMLGAYLREVDALGLLVELLDEHDMLTVQRTLMILGNLCSHSFDPNSAATKQALLGSAALNRIVLHMEDPDDVSTRLYAVAALQV